MFLLQEKLTGNATVIYLPWVANNRNWALAYVGSKSDDSVTFWHSFPQGSE